MSDEMYDLIVSKRAVRRFKDDPLPDELVREIVNAGRLAGSSKNTQPWRFIAVTDRAVLNDLARAGRYADHLAGAALGVVIVQPVPSPSGTPDYDFGRATQNMMLAAWARGVGSCVARLHDPAKAARALGVPEDGYRVDWAISFGYPADENYKPGIVVGGRRAFDEVVYWDQWGQTREGERHAD
jgi:nitroreductase